MTTTDNGQPIDVREIRQAITTAMRGAVRVDGKDTRHGYSAAGNLARNVIILGEREGWSGEDTMTVLAYHALVALEASQDQLMEVAIHTLPKGIILKDPNA